MSSRRTNQKNQQGGNIGFYFCLTFIFIVVLTGTTGTLLWLDGDLGEGEFKENVTTFFSQKDFSIEEEVVPMERVFVVGDSITLGAEDEIRNQIPVAIVDGRVGRTMPEGLEILTDLKNDNLPLDYVVIGLANNVHNNEIKSIRTILQMISPEATRIVFVTGHGRSNMKQGNEFIRALPETYKNVYVADWDEAISEHEEWLGADGIHVSNKKANTLYAQLVEDALTRP